MHPVALTSITVEALAGVRPDPQGQGAREEHVRARPAVLAVHTARPTGTEAFLKKKFGPQARHPRGQPRRAAAPAGQLRRDHRGLRGLLRDRPGEDAARHLPQHHRQRRARLRPGRRARTRAGLPLVLGSYPITPASDILHTLSRAQALRRDARCRPRTRSPASARPSARRSAAPSASPPPPARASRSRPRRSASAVSLELPLVIVDVQRGGPSTGLPTKTEQADLLQAMFGRNGEAPVPIVAPQLAGRLLRRRASRRCGSPRPTARR